MQPNKHTNCSLSGTIWMIESDDAADNYFFEIETDEDVYRVSSGFLSSELESSIGNTVTLEGTFSQDDQGEILFIPSQMIEEENFGIDLNRDDIY